MKATNLDSVPMHQQFVRNRLELNQQGVMVCEKQAGEWRSVLEQCSYSSQ
jgi:hypothetical protein